MASAVTSAATRAYAQTVTAAPRQSPKDRAPPPLLPLLLPLQPAPKARRPLPLPLQLPPPCLLRNPLHQPTLRHNADFSPPFGSQKISNSPTLFQTLLALLANLLLEKSSPKKQPSPWRLSMTMEPSPYITAPKGYATGYYASYCDQLAKATQ